MTHLTREQRDAIEAEFKARIARAPASATVWLAETYAMFGTTDTNLAFLHKLALRATEDLLLADEDSLYPAMLMAQLVTIHGPVSDMPAAIAQIHALQSRAQAIHVAAVLQGFVLRGKTPDRATLDRAQQRLRAVPDKNRSMLVQKARMDVAHGYLALPDCDEVCLTHAEFHARLVLRLGQHPAARDYTSAVRHDRGEDVALSGMNDDDRLRAGALCLDIAQGYRTLPHGCGLLRATCLIISVGDTPSLRQRALDMALDVTADTGLPDTRENAVCRTALAAILANSPHLTAAPGAQGNKASAGTSPGPGAGVTRRHDTNTPSYI